LREERSDRKVEKNGRGCEGPVEAGGATPVFEEAFLAAERAVEALERGDLTLDDALRRYEEGLRALHSCYEILQRTQRRIEVLGEEVGAVVEGADGPAWRPASSFPLLAEALAAVEAAGRRPEGGKAEPEAGGR
jgi:exodeoxyribonuclease VII small subunit